MAVFDYFDTTYHPRTLLVDNYDSYTFNLLQLLLELGQTDDQILIIRNDQYTWEHVRDHILPFIDNIIISPGPGNPLCKSDFGICHDLIRSSGSFEGPILGVCLGHQGIAAAFGGYIRQCVVPVHGQICTVRVEEKKDKSGCPGGIGLFDGVPPVFKVVRYHSLTVSEDEFPESLEVLARATGSVKTLIMALRHKQRNIFGVQFHPESVCSEYGARIVGNFHQITRHSGPNIPKDVLAMSLRASDSCVWQRKAVSERQMRVVQRSVTLANCGNNNGSGDVGGALFEHLYSADPMPLWLDSARPADSAAAKLSVMASAATQDGGITVRYSVADRRVSISFWTWMQRMVDCTQAGEVPGVGFVGGWLGYFGYEMKAECMAAAGPGDRLGSGNEAAPMPDAQLSFVDRCMVVDHSVSPPVAHVLALVAANRPQAKHKQHQQQQEGKEDCRLDPSTVEDPLAAPCAGNSDKSTPVDLQADLGCTAYLGAIARAQELIAQGETYEVCLTTQFRASTLGPQTSQQMQQLYRHMRLVNPAPFGALLWYGDISVGIASCSPERFLSVSSGRIVEMKPIKGTCARAPEPKPTKAPNPMLLRAQWLEDDRQRAQDLRMNAKERAENLMIVDLIRHDLNWIAPGRVKVTRLMDIESYASVHQMVTTVRAQLDKHVGAVAALAHCFPPGSMTGAPKLRTTQILDSLEPGSRGVYSGCLGYFSVCGRADWSVVIRTAVVQCGELSVGAGGALTILSNAQDEWAEVETKLQAVLPGIQRYINEIDSI
ncbi:ADC synthase [Kickxella alabastrina]|uniref:ADC synthase n=1 Tax=Kickxella alabastrina TaxID=61397 RepID=UPI00221EA57B|nr:ADC synthase [Kickxella alabastrina]KAI7822426.1 ADC synthase [Kickxella alabastrina]